MESAEKLHPIKDMETYAFPKKSWPEGNYSVEVTRLPQHSSIDFVFETEDEAKQLYRRFGNPYNEKDLYEGDPKIYEKWKLLNNYLGAPAKLLEPHQVDNGFRVRIVANYEPTEDFRTQTAQFLIDLKLIPQEVSQLLA